MCECVRVHFRNLSLITICKLGYEILVLVTIDVEASTKCLAFVRVNRIEKPSMYRYASRSLFRPHLIYLYD